MRVILLGCPGAGKGTQAKQICNKFHIPPISTGDILREAIQKNNDLGNKVKTLVESGHYAPDDVVIQLVKTRVGQADCERGFLLDGFPRTLTQARALQEMTDIDHIIDIEVSADEVVKRLSGRRIHPASGRTYHLIYHPPKMSGQDDMTGEPLIQRVDDNEATVRQRLQVYETQTMPLREFYQSSENYTKINGNGSMEQITQQIFDILIPKHVRTAL